MDDRFSRTRLLIGDDGIEKLQSAHVVVIGLGAVGSFVVEALARCGIGHLTLVDFDTVAVSNINRQLFALQSTIGTKKTTVAFNRVLDISADIDVKTADVFVDDTNISDIIQGADFVVDAIDSRDSKIAIYKACQDKKIPFISSMGAARHFDPSKIEIDKMKNTTTCPLASVLRKICKKEGISMDFPVVYSTEQVSIGQEKNKTMGSLPTITGIFGLTLANEVIRILLQDNA